jgi:very-short-patch-repair endonuclease
VEQLAELHRRAAEMRRNPTEPEKRLWRHLSSGQLGGHKFRRQSVIGWFIADFLCAKKALIVEVDGDTHDERKDRLRDDVLGQQGFRVVRVGNLDVMTNMEGVLTVIADALSAAPARWSTPHPSPSGEGQGVGHVHSEPRRVKTDIPHPNPSPEGEGLIAVEAQKLLGISLEGSVG